MQKRYVLPLNLYPGGGGSPEIAGVHAPGVYAVVPLFKGGAPLSGGGCPLIDGCCPAIGGSCSLPIAPAHRLHSITISNAMFRFPVAKRLLSGYVSIKILTSNASGDFIPHGDQYWRYGAISKWLFQGALRGPDIVQYCVP
jgi:hypothetical protein